MASGSGGQDSAISLLALDVRATSSCQNALVPVSCGTPHPVAYMTPRFVWTNLWADAGRIRGSGDLRRPVCRRSAGRKDGKCWYGKREGVLDINSAGALDHYLVMTGPKAAPMTSRGQTRPWVITEAFLFDAPALVERLRKCGRHVGTAAKVRKNEWAEAMVYQAAARTAHLTLTDAQREALKLFAETGG